MAKTIYWIQDTKKNRSRKSKDNDGKVLWKLIGNAIYGKAMENLRNRIDVKLVNNEKYYLKFISKPNYMSHKIFDNNLVAIRKGEIAIKLNKPAYVGMCILELKKLKMYEFHYDYMKKIWLCWYWRYCWIEGKDVFAFDRRQ